MGRFPTAGHLVSWAGLCPRNDESAGKRRSTRLRKGAPWLKTTLVQCAWAASRKKASYLQAQYHRLRARRGPRKAVVRGRGLDPDRGLPHAPRRHLYHDLGASHLHRRDTRQQVGRLLKRLHNLGYDVQIALGGIVQARCFFLASLRRPKSESAS